MIIHRSVLQEKIKNIEVNEQLKFGQRVLGIVKIDARKLIHVKRYIYKKQEFVGGVNLQINDALGFVELAEDLNVNQTKLTVAKQRVMLDTIIEKLQDSQLTKKVVDTAAEVQ